MLSALIGPQFPQVSNSNTKITSPDIPHYNCIAWAAADNRRWWWPVPETKSNYWPSGVPRRSSIPAFVAAFATLGYLECDSGHLEEGFEKVVLYVDDALTPTHMARQLSCGKWTSKMGKWHDITHELPETLNGPVYGSAHLFMKRKI